MGFIPSKPDRTPWDDFKTVDILAEISRVHRHPDYAAAKKGDLHAALRLTATILDTGIMTQVTARYTALRPIIVGVQAVEGAGVNIIPQTMAIFLADTLGLSLDTAIVQINRVGHTKASGWHRLLHQALFDGPVQTGADYVLVDDFIGQGGTLANLKGLIERYGGKVIGAIALTGKPYSATLALTQETLLTLRQKHGILESWWREQFGFGFAALTESEARYLLRAEDVDTIRNRLAQAAQAGGDR